MDNLGNTCFFNSVMQCLTHTIPLQLLCLSHSHVKQCQRQRENCYQCRYVNFITDIARNHRTNPAPIVKSLPAIWSGYRIGQQRDAHEFLTIYLEAILNASFHEKPSRVHVIKEQSKTPLFKIFGGKTRSQIRCERCDYRSDTYDETFTFNLPLPRGQDCSFGQALEQYFQVDKLTKDNRYKCPKCKSLQNATKRLSVTSAPQILIVTIKRFDIFGRKITKSIRYPSAFNMKNYMDGFVDSQHAIARSKASSKAKAQVATATNANFDQIYDLYGVVIHKGSSTNSGHYFSYCKSVNNKGWYECNDSFVGPMSENAALNKEAYLLFYQKRSPPQVKIPKPPSKKTVAEKLLADIKMEEEDEKASVK